MQILEIAKATGRTNKQVCEDLGVQAGQGAHLRQVDDEKAAEYIALHGGVERPSEPVVEEQAEPGAVRFWSTKRRYWIPGDADAGRKDIRLSNGIISLSEGSKEVKFMRGRADYFIAQGVYEVREKPHAEPEEIAMFLSALQGTMRTGPANDTTISREVRDTIKELLPKAVSARMSTAEKNNPRQLAQAVAKSVSLVVDDYQEKL